LTNCSTSGEEGQSAVQEEHRVLSGVAGAAVRDRIRLIVFGLLLGFAGIAWMVTAAGIDRMESGPGMYPQGLGSYVSAWVVMMAAMMFPTVWPTVGLYASMQRGRRNEGLAAPVGAPAAFVGGYLFTWTSAGLAVFALLAAGRSLGFDGLKWRSGGHWVAAGVIGLAAVYELTPLKEACLRRCRTPLGFLVSGWRDGRGGALLMGALHGGWCVGCCWALMAVLFALGLMSLAWMLLIAVLIAAEKLLPWRAPAIGAVTAVLVGLSVAVGVAPDAFMD
jgi:predicted metal-binding membrane protein